MDLKRASPGQDVYVSVTSALVSALLEWMLMFMIFMDAGFSYVVTRFARYCQLRIPCLLCSRLDCDERFGLYRDLICHKHKLKISSLVHGTCENSFAKSNDERTIAQKLFQSKSNINSVGAEDGETSELGQMKNKGHHMLPHVEYTKMKVTSDTESESEMETQVLTSADFPALETQVESLVFQSHDSIGSHPTVETEELNKQQAGYNNEFNEPSQPLSFLEATPSQDILGTQETYGSESKKEVDVECGECCNLDSGELQNQVNLDKSSPENEIQVESKPKTSSQILDLGEAYKFAVSSRGRQLSGKLLEQQKSMADSRRASEDVKLLLSQLSFARGIEISPRVSASAEDFGMQTRISLERNESSLSIDGSGISEIEGESVVDGLRRQVEHDKKIKCSLYKELEEEMNASAIAANQAMAMITRLQEEKASLHMEALQYLRMMEEQSAYDSEALDNANNLLAKKEKQIQDLEYELQLQLGKPEIKDVNDKQDMVRSLQVFEDEKQHLLQCLRKLENKLFIFANPDMINGLVMEASDPDLSGNDSNRDPELEAFRHHLYAMNNRLEALETQQNVIECSFNSLENGSEGLEFIREIVARLQDLHSDYIGTRDDNLGFTSH